MSIMTFLIGTPFLIKSKSNNISKILISLAGLMSIALGLALGSDLIFESTFTDILWY